MIALALFIAAGAPAAQALLVPARRVTRGSNRILSEANFEELKLVAADAATGDQFGYSVAIDGDTVVIGAPEAGTGGAVYVLRTTDGGATYVGIARLTAADAAADDDFGHSVAIAGDTVVVGAHYDDDAGSGSGSVYVFRTSDGWATHTEIKLTAADGASTDYFGTSVAIAGGTIVVGATQNFGRSGAVYVFSTSDGGATYVEVAKLTAADAAAYDHFGGSVAIDGATIVVGARQYNTARSGVAYVFRTTDGWDMNTVQYTETKLTASDAWAGDQFGYSVAIDGDTVVVGARYDSDAGRMSGSAYVFRTTDDGATYIEVAKLTAADAASGDEFGISVAIAGDTVVVGAFAKDSARGAAYVFRTSDEGATYGQVPKLTASDGAVDDLFGISVAIDGATIVVGASAGSSGSFGNNGGSGSGSAYVFDANALPALGSDAATRTGPLLALLVATVLAL